MVKVGGSGHGYLRQHYIIGRSTQSMRVPKIISKAHIMSSIYFRPLRSSARRYLILGNRFFHSSRVDLSAEKNGPPPSETEEQDIFSVSRPLHSADQEMTSTEKERMIFSKIFDSILGENGPKASVTQKKPPAIASSLQALFQEAQQDSSSSQPRHNVKVEMTTAGKGKSSSKNPFTFSAQKKTDDSLLSLETEALIGPIIQHIQSLKYDHEIYNYYVDKVLSRYSKKGASKKTSSKTAKSSADELINEPPLLPGALSAYLLSCMKTLLNDFDEPSQAMTLFELSKRQSIEFYAQSCTADVYNFVLRLRWKNYRDLYAVESLVSEMQVNAVLGNSDTIEILGEITRDAIDAKHGMLEQNNIALWNKEDEKRIQNLSRYKLRMIGMLAPTDGLRIPLMAGKF